MELFDGHLFLHLDMGTGHIKIRVSGTGGGVSDGKWHAFHMERTKQFGKVTLDGKGNNFAIPGTNNFKTLEYSTHSSTFYVFLVYTEQLKSNFAKRIII